jgi:hypothetical protein
MYWHLFFEIDTHQTCPPLSPFRVVVVLLCTKCIKALNGGMRVLWVPMKLKKNRRSFDMNEKGRRKRKNNSNVKKKAFDRLWWPASNGL